MTKLEKINLFALRLYREDRDHAQREIKRLKGLVKARRDYVYKNLLTECGYSYSTARKIVASYKKG